MKVGTWMYRHHRAHSNHLGSAWATLQHHGGREHADGGQWDVFLSHDWAGDHHQRVRRIAEVLREEGLRVWVDEDGRGAGEMARGAALVGNAMAQGIERSTVVVVCVTRNYSDKVDMVWSSGKVTDNCLREFSLAVQEKGVLYMVPAVMEPAMKDTSRWGDRLKMDLGEILYEDLSASEDAKLRAAAQRLAERVRGKVIDPMAGVKVTGKALFFKVPFNNVFLAKKKAAGFAPGTRRWILAKVVAWYGQAEWSRMFVLLGAAAVGKSTLAAEVARCGGALGSEPVPLLAPASDAAGSRRSIGQRIGDAVRRRLSGTRHVVVHVGGVHIFNFGEAARNDFVNVFVSLADQLGRSVPGLARVMAQVRQEVDLDELRSQPMVEAFRVLVARPCVALAAMPPPNRVVVILDALDECADDMGQRRRLLDVLLREGLEETPAWLGFLLTARPEDYIPPRLMRFEPTLVDAEQQANLEDMRGYLRTRLAPLVAPDALESAVRLLAERSEGKFLYVRFLDEMLKGKAALTLADIQDQVSFPASMDDVFRTYFERFRDKIGQEVYTALLQPMAVVREPLPRALAAAILAEHATQHDEEDREDEVLDMLSAAQNLLFIGNDNCLRFVHKSMHDWLTARSTRRLHKDLAVSTPKAHKAVAARLVVAGNSHFALRHVLWHLCQSKQYERAADLLLDPSWLLAALQSVNPSALVADAEEVKSRDAAAHDVLRVLDMAAPALRSDPLQLASQLCGRLPHGHRALRGLDEAMPEPWLRPAQPTLTSTRSALRKVLQGHSDWVTSVAIAGDVLVSASRDKTARVWNAKTGEQLRVLQGHTERVTSVAIDGDVIVTGSEDTTVRVWDAKTGDVAYVLQGHGGWVGSVAVCGDLVVSGGLDGVVRVWQNGELRSELEGHFEWVNAVAIAGKTIVSGSADKTVRVWDAQNGRQVHELEGHTIDVVSVAISGDGQVVVSGGFDGVVRVWDAASGEQRHEFLDHSDKVEGVAIAGRAVVSASRDKSMRVWDVLTGEALVVLQRHAERMTSVAAQGAIIVSGGEDSTVRVWKAKNAEHEYELPGHAADVTSVAVDAKGETVVSASRDKSVRVWDAATGEQRHELRGHTAWVNAVVMSGGAIVSASCDKTLRVWGARHGELRHVLEGHSSDVVSLGIEGDTVVSAGGHDKTVRLWNTKTGTQQHALSGHTDAVFAVAIAGDTVVSGSHDTTVRAWSAKTGRLLHVLHGHADKVDTVAIRGDVIASGGKDATVRVWDATSGKQLRVLAAGATSRVAVERRHIISCGEDGFVRIWNAATGVLLHQLRGGTAATTSSSLVLCKGFAATLLDCASPETAPLASSFTSDTAPVASATSGTVTAVGTQGGIVHILHLAGPCSASSASASSGSGSSSSSSNTS